MHEIEVLHCFSRLDTYEFLYRLEVPEQAVLLDGIPLDLGLIVKILSRS